MKRFLLLTTTIIATLNNFVTSQQQEQPSPCDCHTVTSWLELRTLIMSSTLPANIDHGGVQVNLPLCPFNIGKDHDHTKDAEHWRDVIYISSPIHIYCKKSNPSDKCSITMIGEDCEPNVNCGRQLFKFMSGESSRLFYVQKIEKCCFSKSSFLSLFPCLKSMTS